MSPSRSAKRSGSPISLAGMEGGIAKTRAFQQSLCQLAVSRLIDRVNARARQDIMKLVQQEDLPQPANRCFRVRILFCERGKRGRGFSFDKGVLELTVQELNLPLGRECRAVIFEVFLTDPDRQRVGGNFFIELCDATHLEFRETWKITKPTKTFQHLSGRPATPIAVAKREERRIMILLAAELPPGFAQFESG